MEGKPRWSLVVAILGSTMAFVDGTVVNVALPIMQKSLGGTVSQMEWIVEAYAVLLAALVLVGGALGDRLGRRRVFLVGVTLFSIASMACGLAPSALFLILARAVQGVGASLLVPGSLSLISAAYSKEERGGAIGTWSSTTAIMSALGPVLGGWLVGHASWRWLFFINVPIGVIVVVIALTHVRETRDEDADHHTDIPGATLAIIGLGAIVLGLVEAPRLGRTTVIGLVVAGIAILVVFVIVEAKSKAPMVPLSLFASRTFSGANALTLLLYAALGGAFFFLPFDLIQVQHYSPAAAGASLLPLVVLISVMSPFAGKLVKRFGARALLTVGPLFASGGFVLLSMAGSGGTYVTTIFPGAVVLGFGMGLTVAPLTTAVMGAVSEHHTGAASGVNNAVARAASVLAIAALGVVLTASFDAALDEKLNGLHLTQAVHDEVLARRSELAGMDLSSLAGDAGAVRSALEASFVVAFRVLMLTSAALAAVGALLALLLVEPPARRP